MKLTDREYEIVWWLHVPVLFLVVAASVVSLPGSLVIGLPLAFVLAMTGRSAGRL